MARRRSQQEISLFPFLAVLVCTMGALILLLLVTTRRIQDSKNEVREAASASEPPERKKRTPFIAPDDSVGSGDFIIAEGDSRGTAHRFASVLQPASALAELESEQARVLQVISETESEIDDTNGRIRSLQKQIADLEASAQKGVIAAARLKADKEELARRKGIQARLSEDLQGQLRRLMKLKDAVRESQLRNRDQEVVLRKKESELISLRREADRSRSQVESVQGGETVVRFTNSTGTQRNPILINVVEDRFEFVPHTEVPIKSDDLRGFPVTDNPLLSCVLAIHDARSKGSISSKPYVLLLVRPSGSLAFYTAQRTLKESGIHFGYELIREDHPVISTPPVESSERSLLQSTMHAAFKRRQELYAGIIRQPATDRSEGAGRRLQVLPDGGVAQNDDRIAAAPRYYAGGAAPPPVHRRQTFGRWDPNARRQSENQAVNPERHPEERTVIAPKGSTGSTEAVPFLRNVPSEDSSVAGGPSRRGRQPSTFDGDLSEQPQQSVDRDSGSSDEEGQFTQLTPQIQSPQNDPSQQSGRPGTTTETAPPRTRTAGTAEHPASAAQGGTSVAASDQDDFMEQFLRQVEEQKSRTPNPYLLALLRKARRDKTGTAKMPAIKLPDESLQQGGRKAGDAGQQSLPSSRPFEFKAPQSHAPVTETPATSSPQPTKNNNKSAEIRLGAPQPGATAGPIRIILKNGVMSVGDYPSVNISTWGRQKVLAETARLLRREITTTGRQPTVTFYASPEMLELQQYLAKQLEPAGVAIDRVQKLRSDALIRRPQGTQQPANPVQVRTGNRGAI